MSQKSLVLIVIDGLTPAVFERAVENGDAPALAFLATARHATRAPRRRSRRSPRSAPRRSPPGRIPTSTTSRTSSGIDRGERRIVEYGSSFGAVRRGRDAPLAARHDLQHERAATSGAEAVTVFEALDDAGLVTAAVNFTCYRGRTEHRATLPGVTRTVLGPRRFFFYNLFESDDTGAPLSVRRRAAGTIDEYAAAVGRWLVTRDGFDFLALLPLRLRLRLARARPRGRGRQARRLRPGDRVALRRGRRAGRVPRAVRRDPLLRPRPDGGRTGGVAGGGVRRPQHLPPQRLRPARRGDLRLEPRRPGLPDAALRRDPAQPGRAPRRPARRSTSRCSSRTARRSHAGTARSCGSTPA